MASLIKRNNVFNVIYTITDENGKKKQKWEPSIQKLRQREEKRKLNTIRISESL